MNIVLLKPGDEALLQRAENVFYPGATSIERAAMLLREPSYVMVVALNENEAVMGRIYGHVLHRFDATDLLLYEVDVVAAHQRQGVGRVMIEFLKDFCHARGYREMWVLTETHNDAGNGLYRSTGGSLEGSPANMYVFPIARP
jgi:aminoglycoside 3-N-acetyltransferase I